jgi:hypothetical protein
MNFKLWVLSCLLFFTSFSLFAQSSNSMHLPECAIGTAKKIIIQQGSQDHTIIDYNQYDRRCTIIEYPTVGHSFSKADSIDIENVDSIRCNPANRIEIFGASDLKAIFFGSCATINNNP